jgi:uncharacterized protein YozE (UPF0346 family)
MEMSESTVKKPVTFYEYLKEIEEEHPGLNNIAHAAVTDVFFPRTQDKSEMYKYLKESGLPKYVLEGFQKMWEIYASSDRATSEISKQVWKEKCDEYKKREGYLIEHYCSEIRNEVLYYDQTFEEMEESSERIRKRHEERWKAEFVDKTIPAYTNARIEYANLRDHRPEGMSDAEYAKKKRELRGQAIQENKEYETDWKIRMRTPSYIVRRKIDAVDCG